MRGAHSILDLSLCVELGKNGAGPKLQRNVNKIWASPALPIYSAFAPLELF